jgi:hypothetical protein
VDEEPRAEVAERMGETDLRQVAAPTSRESIVEGVVVGAVLGRRGR